MVVRSSGRIGVLTCLTLFASACEFSASQMVKSQEAMLFATAMPSASPSPEVELNLPKEKKRKAINRAQPQRLAFLPDSDSNRLKVELLDSEGRRVENDSLHVALEAPISPEGAKLQGPLKAKLEEGVATFEGFSTDVAGTYRFTARAEGMDPGVSQAFVRDGEAPKAVGAVSKDDKITALDDYMKKPPKMVFKTLLIIKKVTQVPGENAHSEIQGKLSDAQVAAIKTAFEQHLPGWAATLSEGSLRWLPRVEISDVPLKQVRRDAGGRPYVTRADLAEDLEKFSKNGEFDHIFFAVQLYDEKTKLNHASRLGHTQGGFSAGSKYAGLSTIYLDPSDDYSAYGRIGTESFLREWVQQLVDFYSARNITQPRCAVGNPLHCPGENEHGEADPKLNWKKFYGDYLNGRVKNRGLGAAAWALGLIRTSLGRDQLLEAEDAVELLEGGAEISPCTVCSGQSKVMKLGSMRFPVHVEKAGNYVLSFHYLNGEEKSLEAQVQVNEDAAMAFVLPPLGDWALISEAKLNVVLKEGLNIVQLTGGTGFTGEIDRIGVLTEQAHAEQPAVAITSHQGGSAINQVSESMTSPIAGSCNRESARIVLEIDGKEDVSVSGVCVSGAWNSTFNSLKWSNGKHSILAVLKQDDQVLVKSPVVFLKKDNTGATAIVTMDSPLNTSQVEVRATGTSFLIAKGTCNRESSEVALLVNGNAQPAVPCSRSQWTAQINISSWKAGTSYNVAARLQRASGTLATSTTASIKAIAGGDPFVKIDEKFKDLGLIQGNSVGPLTGTCNVAGAAVTLVINGKPDPAQTSICNSGVWSQEIGSKHLDQLGLLTISAQMTMPEGTQHSSMGVNWTLSKTALVAIGTPVGSTEFLLKPNSTEFAFSGTCNHSGSEVELEFTGPMSVKLPAGVCGLSSWEKKINPIVDLYVGGTYSVTARMKQGNQVMATSSAVTFTIKVEASPASIAFSGAILPGASGEIQPVIQVLAPDRKPLANKAVTLVLALDQPTPGSALIGTTTFTNVMTDASGNVKLAGAKLPKSGTYRLKATLQGTAPALSGNIQLTKPAKGLKFTANVPTADEDVSMQAFSVAVVDEDGTTVLNHPATVTIALNAHNSSCDLLGTKSREIDPATGIATFTGIRIDHDDSSLRMRATAPGLTEGYSNYFRVTN